MDNPTGFLLRYPARDLSAFIGSLEVARSVLSGEREMAEVEPRVLAEAADAVGAIAREMRPIPTGR